MAKQQANNPFQKATKYEAKLRLALIGPAGSGKTYTALSIASHLGQRVAVIDTERGSASKYADLFTFDVVGLDSHHPQQYINMIQAAQAAGYGVLIIDSLSHAWMGKDGALALVDEAAKRKTNNGRENSFSAWRDITPLHNALVDAMVGASLHIIVTMRAKMEYVQEKDEKGKTTIRKVGLQPVQRDGLEYEFDVVADLDTDNYLIVGKTRCPALRGVVVQYAGQEVAEALQGWLQGTPEPDEEPAPTPLYHESQDSVEARDLVATFRRVAAGELQDKGENRYLKLTRATQESLHKAIFEAGWSNTAAGLTDLKNALLPDAEGRGLFEAEGLALIRFLIEADHLVQALWDRLYPEKAEA